MERKIWTSDFEPENKKDSLYIATEIVKEHARAPRLGVDLCDLLGKVYSKVEELRKEIVTES